jgi:peroxisomal membrane protein 4
MTFLFRNGTLLEKIKAILLATYTHSTNLARFVIYYKVVRLLFKILSKEINQFHTMIAGELIPFKYLVFLVS